MQRWSGDGSWEYHEYPVSAGVHQFRWTYSKDGASVYFNDCAWVDAVDLPEGTTPLNPPLFTEAQVINGNNIELNWSPPTGTNPTLVGYRIYRNGVQQVQYNNPALTLYVDYNMPNGDYSYYVRAVYSEGISNPGNSSSVTVEIPYAPRNLSVVLSGVNSALLEWQAPPLLRDRVLMGYQVYRDNVVIAQVENPEALQYIDAGLAEGVYYYEITAMYSVGESARSNMAQLAVGVPNPPSNFQAVVNGSTVNLSWSQVPDTTFLTGFKLFRNGAMIANLTNPLQLTYSDQNLLNGAYSYIVRAVYGDVDSGNSLPANVFVEVPYPPTNVSVSVTGDDVQISWTNPQLVRALTHYYIYRGGQIIAAIFNPNTTMYLDQNLANGIYTYTITAVYSGIESLPSAPVQALVEVLYPPTNLMANVSLADVALSWTIPVNQGGLTRSFNGYNVYRDGVLVNYVSGGTVNHYTDYSVPNGLYTYSVRAVYSTGESTPASIGGVLVEVLYPVTTLNYAVDDDDITLMWTAAATSPGRDASDRAFTAYKVYRDGMEIAQTTALSYVDADLSNGIYQYYVTALYGSGESIPSPEVTVHLEVLYPPTALSATVQDDDVSLEWTSPATSGGLGRAFIEYQVHRDGA
ncbi:MAG: hypothetical protein U1B83_04460, partial [Candidatus Cloacimonadaceae bacterium]|nr:hypothetical protein [Candidatus Cloacimonadaceae bacterium]